jgi:orotidine-5'-phosphate decarboxylase
MGRNFMELLKRRWAESKFVCVGLDTVAEKVPKIWPPVTGEDYPSPKHIIRFNKGIIAATADLVCAYKPNSAFYEAMGQSGWEVLHSTVNGIHEEYPEIPVIVDAKRADIGQTNQAYVRAIFEYIGADSITVHPYLGQEALKPFLDLEDKGIIVLCKTSNKGAGEFQDRLTYLSYDELGELTDDNPLPKGFEDQWTANMVGSADNRRPGYLIPLYQLVALRVSRAWNKHGNCCLVVGATYPDELKIVRQIVGEDMPILVPGIGKQGGDLAATVKNGMTKQGGLIINSSSGIIFASNGPDFLDAASLETDKLHQAITGMRKEMRI